MKHGKDLILLGSYWAVSPPHQHTSSWELVAGRWSRVTWGSSVQAQGKQKHTKTDIETSHPNHSGHHHHSILDVRKMYLVFFIISIIQIALSVAELAPFRGRHLRSEQDIVQAFSSDGWKVVNQTTLESGSRGFYAEHETAVILGTGLPKKSYYVEGSGYDMGYLQGTLSAIIGDAKATCTTYVHHIIFNMLAESLDEEMAEKWYGISLI